MKKVDFGYIKRTIKGRRVVILGSAPSVLLNKGKDIDKYEIIIRVNNYDLNKYKDYIGTRTDIHFSFYGSSVKKSREELIKEGTYLCMCKCPNEKVFDHHKMVSFDKSNLGGDYRYVYRLRKDFWFSPVYIPHKARFLDQMKQLNGHMPTTGFSAILTVIECEPRELYITGFDGFASKKHNIDQPWRDKSRRDDPISHKPSKEILYLKELTLKHEFIKLDIKLNDLLFEDEKREKIFQEFYNPNKKEDIIRIYNSMPKDDILVKLWTIFGWSAFVRSSVLCGFREALKTFKIGGPVALEIGCFNGITTLYLSKVFDKVITIDIVDPPLRRKIFNYFNMTNVEFIHLKGEKGAAGIIRSLNFNFAFLDGDHENHTYSDWNVTKKCKNVLFHEYWKGQPMVWTLVNSLPKKEVSLYVHGRDTSPWAYWRGK